MSKIAHLTSAHPRYDTRIFIKQCRSLADHGHDVTLVVADGKGDERKDGVSIVDVGKLHGRINRMFSTTRRILNKAIILDADIYHLHDPELIPIGLRLKQLGKKIIFDSHEDVPKQLLSKPYLGPTSLQLLSDTFSVLERFACRRFDGIIAATPSIRDKFLAINPHTVAVNNYPLIDELNSDLPWSEKHNEVCYIGSIGAIRGIRQIVSACELLQSPVRLNLGGSFSEPALEAEVKTYPGWDRVNSKGFLDRAGVRNMLHRSMAGLVTLHPIINYLDALPVKMFEYMAAGIPVIASNFPLWREIIEGNHCGVCVDPLNPKAIADVIDYLVINQDVAKRMGENGRKAVMEQYNWPTQEKILLNFYETI